MVSGICSRLTSDSYSDTFVSIGYIGRALCYVDKLALGTNWSVMAIAVIVVFMVKVLDFIIVMVVTQKESVIITVEVA